MTRDEVIERLSELSEGDATAFIGLGNRDRGDDAIGLKLIDSLEHLDLDRFFSEEQGLESAILSIIEEKEIENVVFIDACDLDSDPGDIILSESHEIDDTGISTHKPSLSLFMAILEQEGKHAFLLGIQPLFLEFGRGVSREIEETSREIAEIIRRSKTR